MVKKLVTCVLDGGSFGEVFEGAGSLIEYAVSAYIWAKYHKRNYVFTPITKIGHFEHHNIESEDWDKMWNEYISKDLLRSDEPYNPKESYINHFTKGEKFIYSNQYALTKFIGKLRRSYKQNTRETYFDHKRLNVAIHIRRYTSTDCDTDSSRNYYTPDNHMKDYFINVINEIKKQDPNSVFHIYSQGDVKDFDEISRLPDVILHLDENPIITLHHMIKADVLVMSKSSFSHIAAIYSSGFKIARLGFRMITDDIHLTNLDGTQVPFIKDPSVKIHTETDIGLEPYLQKVDWEKVKNVRFDIGLSYNAPQSQRWLSENENLTVFGFEPNPLSCVAILDPNNKKRESVHGDPLNVKYIDDKFFLFPVALSEKKGRSIFYITEKDEGCSSLYRPKGVIGPVKVKVSVAVYTLSDLFKLIPENILIEYIKIDAQGSDLNILKGAGEYLRNRVIYVTAEADGSYYHDSDCTEQNITEYMKTQGFLRVYNQKTKDPTFLNSRFKKMGDLIRVTQD